MSTSVTIDDGNGKEKYPVGTTLLFEDILDTIFTNLSLRDLHRAARVCTVWLRVAKEEILRRNNIEGLILPIMDGNKTKLNVEDIEIQNHQIWHISDSLRSLPYFLLLFHDELNHLTLKNAQIFHNYYEKQLTNIPHEIVVLNAIAVTRNDTDVAGAENFGIGISIPFTSKLKINYFCDGIHVYESPGLSVTELIDKAIDSLSIVDDEHCCYIIFESPDAESVGDLFVKDHAFTNGFLDRLKSRSKPGTYSLWGGCILNILLSKNDWTDYFILKISGSALKSWSLVTNEKASTEDLENQLLQFKESIVLTSNSIALAIASVNDNEFLKERLKKTELFRKIFPNIPLFGIYEGNFQVGVNTVNPDPNSVLIHRDSIVYLVITTV